LFANGSAGEGTLTAGEPKGCSAFSEESHRRWKLAILPHSRHWISKGLRKIRFVDRVSLHMLVQQALFPWWEGRTNMLAREMKRKNPNWLECINHQFPELPFLKSFIDTKLYTVSPETKCVSRPLQRPCCRRGRSQRRTSPVRTILTRLGDPFSTVKAKALPSQQNPHHNASHKETGHWATTPLHISCGKRSVITSLACTAHSVGGKRLQ